MFICIQYVVEFAWKVASFPAQVIIVHILETWSCASWGAWCNHVECIINIEYNSLSETANDLNFLLKVENGHSSATDILGYYCDGSIFNSHPLYSREKNGLQILFYFDELEICNPLGSKTKIHKLGM